MNSQNSICNIKMEENISEETFRKNLSTEGQGVVKVKQENTEERIKGMYYSYTVEHDWNSQERKNYHGKYLNKIAPEHYKL